MLMPQGVIRSKKAGLLAMRSSGPVYLRAASHIAGVAAKRRSEGEGEPLIFAAVISNDPGSAKATKSNVIAAAAGVGFASHRASPAAAKIVRTRTPGRTARQPRSLFW